MRDQLLFSGNRKKTPVICPHVPRVGHFERFRKPVVSTSEAFASLMKKSRTNGILVCTGWDRHLISNWKARPTFYPTAERPETFQTLFGLDLISPVGRINSQNMEKFIDQLHERLPATPPTNIEVVVARKVLRSFGINPDGTPINPLWN